MSYPPKIKEIVRSHNNDTPETTPDAMGTEVNLLCGSMARFFISFDNETVTDLSFVSNGCGFMLAGSHWLTGKLENHRLAELGGLDPAALIYQFETELGSLPSERRRCFLTALDALRAAFRDLRSARLEEFRGEKALICTCFGVSEERIEDLIETKGLKTVEEVSVACNAGAGCGSCGLLIQEIIDAHRF